MQSEYADLITPNDVALLVKWAELPLKPGVSEADAAAFISEAIERAAALLLTIPEDMGSSWADIRAWLDSVANDAAALLQRLGFDPERAWVERVGRVVVFDSGRFLMDYMQHLSTGSFIDGPPDILESPAFYVWLKPQPGLAPHDAVLRALPECLAVLMTAARQSRADLETGGAGRLRDHFQAVLCDALAQAHIAMFGRKPVLRDGAGARGGSGAAWARVTCQRAAEQAGQRPVLGVARLQTHLQAVTKLEDATLQDQLGGGRKPRRKSGADLKVTVEKIGGLASLTPEQRTEIEEDNALSPP